MPARQRYAAPHEQVFALAVEARREGRDFENFWDRALRPALKLVTTESVRTEAVPPGAVVWPKDSTDRANAIAATKAAKEYWQRAYEKRPPTRGEEAFSQLWGLIQSDFGGIKNGDGLELTAAP